MKKKLIAKLLVLAMVLAMVPATLLAASAAGDNSNSGQSGDGGSFNLPDTSVVTPSEDDTTDVVPVEEIPEDGVIEAEVSEDGTANVVLSEAAVESLAEMVEDGEIVLEIADDGANELNVTLPVESLVAVAKDTGADLTIKSSVATVTIPNDVLSSELGTTGNVKISVQATENSVGFSIQVDGHALKGLKGIKVEF